MTEYKPIPSDYRLGKLPLPTGRSDWADMASRYYLVDKTLLIKELWDNAPNAALFTRPRRFGKTTMLQMLKTFFEKTAESKAPLFKDKLIWQAGEPYRQLQGHFPVIYLTFKDHKGLTWEQALHALRRDVCNEVVRHKCIFDVPWDNQMNLAKMQRIAMGESSPDDLADALGLLAEAVHARWGVKPFILIDEYDSPITSASTHDYYDEMVAFMRVFLAGALKDCQHCQMGVMTGVLRVAKEGILSGLNNLDVYSVFNAKYSQYFGFTEDEVRQMAEYYKVPDRMAEIREWYDGYNFAGTEIYNPWSVTKYFQEDCNPQPYWLNTSSNDIVNEVIEKMPFGMWRTLEALLAGKSPLVPMTRELGPYQHIRDNADTLYALLVSTGYLKCVSELTEEACRVLLPNKEIYSAFRREIISGLRRKCSASETLLLLQESIATHDSTQFKRLLAAFLRESVSYFDGAAEGFFHGLVLGFLAMMRDLYRVTSNAESGDGRYDIQLRPLADVFPGVVIEIKAAGSEDEDLENLAAIARRQIDEKGYVTDMRASGVTDILAYGLAFFRKSVSLME